MRDADGHAKGGLPVAMAFVPHEVEVPVGHAVEFAEDAAAAELTRGGLGLLGGGELLAVAERVDAGEEEAAVAAHGFAQGGGLRRQRRLLHHMARAAEVVLFAPVADGVRESGCKAFGHMVMETIAGQRVFAIRQFPDEFGKRVVEIDAVGRLVGFGEVVRERQIDNFLLLREGEGAFAGELRFVRENGGNGLVELLADALAVGFVRDVDELLDGARVERVDVGLVVVP